VGSRVMDPTRPGTATKLKKTLQNVLAVYLLKTISKVFASLRRVFFCLIGFFYSGKSFFSNITVFLFQKVNIFCIIIPNQKPTTTSPYII
jgi:hypothetical protein